MKKGHRRNVTSHLAPLIFGAILATLAGNSLGFLNKDTRNEKTDKILRKIEWVSFV